MSAVTAIPARAGIGFKPVHFDALLAAPAATGWIEIHAENYFGAGGPPHHMLEALREQLPLSIHGVGLSLGGAEALDRAHLRALSRLVERYRPGLVSEHLAWCAHGGQWLNDLLPLPLNRATLDHVCAHVIALQDALGRQVLIENPARYLDFEQPEAWPEAEFLAELSARSGCGLLLDINNVVVSAHNLGFDAAAYIDALPPTAIGEIHLAGHTIDSAGPLPLRIDDHGSPVDAETWALYARLLRHGGPRPTLIEWDTRVPTLAVLLGEAACADARLLRLAEAA
ncbi:DUF692 domain-containing protein [Plasticicumulans acidivorans]|uniref:Uncharacterized protein n=1 Tax=Plasticicumulans acidivorans TaxID=886464 RepID=A0A317MSK6_9GAMM|nr:DUF692 domain-containing protein [Plasticicumulans acidivorans]PWV60160.1 hypothetical protein C7443_10889 [Plasticicumulans acidivorans]